MSVTPRFARARAVIFASWICSVCSPMESPGAVGQLDPSFGSMGKMTVAFSGGSSEARDVTIQPDGKIVAAGYGPLNGNPAFAVVRFHPSGMVDESFGGTGKVLTALGEFDMGSAVALQSDGKILLTGSTNLGGIARIGIARYTTSGELDPSFGTLGKVITPGSGSSLFGSSVALQSDGSVLVGGTLRAADGDSRMVVFRYDSSGMPDSSFGTGGMATVEFGDIDVLGKVLVQPDDKIILSGGSFAFGINRSRMAVARLTAQGLPDEGFGSMGKELTEVGPGTASATDAALQPDGKVVLVGNTNAGTNSDFALVRYTTSGKLDDTFGDKGKVITELGSEVDKGNAVALQRDGSIVVAGKIGTFVTGSNGAFVVVRYTSGGIPDPTFNGTGFAKTQITLNDDARGIAIQADTKIVAAGSGTHPPSVFALARYIADDTTQAPTLNSPVSGSVNNSNVSIGYLLPEAASEATLTFNNGLTDYVITLAAPARVAGSHQFIIPAGDPTNSPMVASGLPIPNGIYTVTLSYRDIAGNPPAQAPPATGVVIDYTPPEISAPNIVEAIATESIGVSVTFNVTVTDNLDPQPSLVVEPPSGSIFPVGATLVTATAEDAAGNEIGRLFYVIVTRTAVVSITGQLVPGAGEPDGVPAGSTWQSIGIPSLLGSGEEIGFSGRIHTPAGSKRGIISLAGGKAKMLLQIGDSARGPTGDPVNGVKFTAFREPVWGDVASFAVAAKVAGRGISTSNDDGVWVRNTSGTISEVAREGAVAPDTNGARFKAFTSIVMTSPSRVFVHAKLRGPGISLRNDDSLCEWTLDAGLKLLQQEGFPVRYAGGPSEVVRSIQALNAVPKSPGHGRYNEGHISVRYLFSNNAARILSLNSTGPEIELSSGTPIAPGITPIDFGTPCFKSPTHFSTLARLEPGGLITNEDNVAIIRENELVARQGTPAPDADGAEFAAFHAPVTEADVDQFQTDAFIASLSGSDVTKQNNEGIWAQGRSLSNLSLVAREGAEPVGAPGTLFRTFTSLAVMNHHGVVFTAKLKSGTERVTKSKDDGLWAVDSLGIHRLLLREGDVVGGKKVRSFTALGAVAGSPAQRRSLRPGNTLIACRVVFTDGSTGIVTSNVP